MSYLLPSLIESLAKERSADLQAQAAAHCKSRAARMGVRAPARKEPIEHLPGWPRRHSARSVNVPWAP